MGVREGPVRRTVTLLALAAAGMLACQDTLGPVLLTSVTLNHTADTLGMGQVALLHATLYHANGDTVPGGVHVEWAASDTSVVTVDTTGYTTAVGIGTATVTATVGVRTGSAAFTVTDSAPGVSRVSPAIGAAGTHVGLYGTHFPPGATGLFDPLTHDSVGVVPDTLITTAAPATAPTRRTTAIGHTAAPICGAHPGAGLAADFGDPPAELAAARDGLVLADLSHWGLIGCSGDDAQDFLHDQITNDLRDLTPERAVFAAYCTAKGRMLANFLVFKRGDDLLVMLPEALRETIKKRLTMFVLRAKVRLRDAGAEWLRLGLSGPGAGTLLAEAAGLVPAADILSVAHAENAFAVRLSGERFDLFATPDTAPALWKKLAARARPIVTPAWDWLMVAGGIPAAAFGASQEVYDKTLANMLAGTTGVNGLGGTLTGNAFALAAMRATLEKVITKRSFDRMIPLATRWTEGVADAIEGAGLPWHVVQLGARAEYRFRAPPPRNGAEAIASKDALLDKYVHLMALNRGILLTPFHNMALMCPATTRAMVDRHTAVFRETVEALAG